MKIYILFILLILFSCRKDEKIKIDGPDLYDVYGEFAVLSDLNASQVEVDFSNGENIYFECSLAKIVDWKISIVGQESGAEKIIEGTGKELDVSNSIWNGSTTNLPFFKSESCVVSLTFEGEEDTLTTSLTILAPKVNNGVLVTDFESGWNSGWSTFIQSGANMDFNIKNDGSSPQGASYYNMQGKVNWDWLIGLIDFNASSLGSVTFPLNDNAENLYFNILVYGEQGLPNTLMLLRFDEDENLDGTFDEQSEDQYTYEFPVDWEGWRLISVKYAELDGGGNGDGKYNPEKLNKVSVLHLANPSSGFAKSAIDYLIFTENAELEP